MYCSGFEFGDNPTVIRTPTLIIFENFWQHYAYTAPYGNSAAQSKYKVSTSIEAHKGDSDLCTFIAE